ncbi:ATP-binding protein, partial [bacterium]|nr:ATP-binding protein [bacterium]
MIPRGATNGETNELELAAPNKFVQDWFNEHYAHFVRDILFELTDREFRVKVALDPSGRKGQLDFALPGTATVEDSAADASKRQARSRSFVAEGQGLNPRYTFSRYVVGANNQFACAACLSVAKKPGKTFNPVFLYGDTGLGKTHLLHAIGHYMLSGGKPMNIASMTSERFTNELIHAIHHGQINAFRKKYRRIDALLIDDIQFLAGKERTQEEFFHTFNDLYEAGAQIVVVVRV